MSENPIAVVKRLERAVIDWRNCQLTSDEFSVQLAHASRDFNAAVDRWEGADER